MRELIEERLELARTPLASPGVSVREEVATVTGGRKPVGVYDEVRGAHPDPERDTVAFIPPEELEYAAVTVADAVYAFLEDFEENRGRTVRLEKRDGGDLVDATEKPATNSFAKRARKRRYAELMGFEREVPAAFEEPVVAMLSLTASATDADGAPRPPADVAREIAESFSASGGVRETLRNRLESGLGLEPDEWEYIAGGEPHPGDGDADGYQHKHVAVVVDAAATDAAVTDATFRPAVEAHLEACPTAGPAAHGEEAVSVRRVDESDGVGSVGRYVGEYLAADVDKDVLEQSLSYLIWGATMWATSSQKFHASRGARDLIDADRCRSECEEGRHGPHGAVLSLTTDAWGRERVECAHCGSAHDVPDTHRAAQHSRAVAHREESDEESEPERDTWRDADAVGRVSEPVRERECPHPDGANECPLCAESVGAVDATAPIPAEASAPEPPPGSVERTGWVDADADAPEWQLVAVVDGDGEEHEVSGGGGGVEYVEVTDRLGTGGCRFRVRQYEQGADESGEERRDGGAEASHPDGRRAILDAVRAASSGAKGATVPEVAGRAGMDPETVEEYVSALARTGRVRSVGAGEYVVT